MANLNGRKLGKYELIERLGRGGAAEVYKAFQPGIERFVAIKVLHSHLIDSADFVARFRREARAIGRLQHPNIVRVIDFDLEEPGEQVSGDHSNSGDEKFYYMVMDHIAGGTLSEYLKAKHKNGQAVSVEEALRIGAQLAHALAHAHAQGMIHRDIKPGNIMFTDEERTQSVLTDFGLAHLRDTIDPRLTTSGALIGTPTYMSPEAVCGEVCDARSDLYSLGVVLYEMVTGKPPYMADTPYSMMMKQAKEPLPLPSSINPALPVAVEQLLLKILSKEPADRHKSATEFAIAIQETQALLRRHALHQTASVAVTPATAFALHVTPVTVTATTVTPTTVTPVVTTTAQLNARKSFLRRLRSPQAKHAANTGAQLASIAVREPVGKPQKRGWLALVLAVGGVAVVASLTTVLLIAF